MDKRKIEPGYLKPGDKVVIISPSFHIEGDVVAEASDMLSSWGLVAGAGKNVLKREGPFAGSDAERLADLQEATDDPDVKAVFCSRGGYGVSRIISKVDFTALRRQPRWYVGFSDITVLHMWLREVCNIVSIHGEMPVNFKKRKARTSVKSLRGALFGEYDPCRWKGDFVNASSVKGEVTGGNLSLLYSLTGTPAEPSTRGKILFIEEVGENYYHVDRMMTSLRLAGKLEGLSALVVGGMIGMKNTRTPWGKTVNETIADVVKGYGYPVFFNFPAGHISDNRAFYIGRDAEIDVKGGEAVLCYK